MGMIQTKSENLTQSFKSNGLGIEIKCNLKTVDFLDITFDLTNWTCRPYNNPNKDLFYINTESNHPVIDNRADTTINFQTNLNELCKRTNLQRSSTRLQQQPRKVRVQWKDHIPEQPNITAKKKTGQEHYLVQSTIQQKRQDQSSRIFSQTNW